MCGITRGDGGVAPHSHACLLEYYSHVRCTVALPDMHSDWMTVDVKVIYVGPLSHLEV